MPRPQYPCEPWLVRSSSVIDVANSYQAGFIPRSGKGMTVPILIKGLTDGMNVGVDFDTAIGLLGKLNLPLR